MENGFRSGFITLIGRPNVGKSTLVNALVGQKITIISDRPQTTRHQVQGVLTLPDCQMVFIDTPGVHKPMDRMGEYLLESALRALDEVDGILFLVDGQYYPGGGDKYIAELLREVKTPVIGVVNKIDLSDEKKTASYRQFFKDEFLTISALKRHNIEVLVEKIKDLLPEGPQYFPEDMVTDQPEQFIVAELIREKAFILTRDEVPHSLAVEVTGMKKREGSELVDIHAHIYVQRKSQKGIIIGQGGSRLKEIGQKAREDIEALLGSKVYLDIWVKVKKDWRDREEEMRRLGYR